MISAGSDARQEGSGTRPAAWAGSLGLALLLAMAAISPAWLLYDERYYMEVAYLLREGPGFAAMMATPLDVAAGPLYGYLHYLLAPLTGLAPPAIRFVNPLALMIALAAMADTLRSMGQSRVWSRALLLLAVPMIWPCAGLALTEIPALALVSLGTAAVARRLARPEVRDAVAGDWIGFAFAGLCLGVAVMGRQTYLPAAAGFVLIGLGRRTLLGPAFAGLGGTIAGMAPMLVTWHGITPPWSAQVVTGLVPAYGVMAFVYLATATLLIAPRFFLPLLASRRTMLMSAAVVLALSLGAALLGLRFDIASQIVGKLPPGLQTLARLGGTLAMTGIAASLLLAGLTHLWQRRDDRLFLLLAIMVVLLNGTAAGISHQFSSRYVLVAFPFALLMLQPWVRTGWWSALRIVIGGALGIASLSAYYWNQTPAPPTADQVAPRHILDQMPYEPSTGQSPHE